MITPRRSDERGHANYGWLDTYHTFSFGRYYDPGQMGFRSLRVINEDYISPGQGFGTHPHDNMEIVTVVLSGELAHRDSTGGGSTIDPHVVQRMTAGTGITHSEFNPSAEQPTHLLQIWILPRAAGLPPSYEEKRLPPGDAQGRFQLLVSPDGEDGSLRIEQDVRLFRARLSAGESLEMSLHSGHHAWVQVTRGELSLNDVTLSAGDGAAVSDERKLAFRATTDSDWLVFDLA